MFRVPLLLLLLGLNVLASTPSLAQDAPFGLAWQMSLSRFLALEDIVVLSQEGGKAFQAVVATRLPKNLNYTDTYGLLFSNRTGLLKVVWSGIPQQSDPTGGSGRDRFQSLQAMLSEKYGPPAESQLTVGNFGEMSFYECLSLPDCGTYHARWVVEPMTIRLQLMGESRTSGRVLLTYQHRGLAEEMEKAIGANRHQDQDAL